MSVRAAGRRRVWWCVEARQGPGAVPDQPGWGRLTIYKRSGQRKAIQTALAALDLPNVKEVVIKVKRDGS